MGEWKECKLGDFAKYVNRGVSPKYIEKGGIIVINQKCIRNGSIDYSLARLHDKSKKFTQEKLLQNNDILINSTGVGTAGRVAIFENKIGCIVDSHVSILRLNNDVSPKYIYYNLRKREKELEETAEGSTGQIELKRDGIKELDILLPPLPEQKAIAEILSSLDDKIDLLHRQNKTLEQMAETLFRQWFVEEAEDDWEEVSLSFFADNIRENVKVENLSNHEYYVGLEYIPRKRMTLDNWGSTDLLGSNKSSFNVGDILFGKLRSYFHKVVFAPIDGVCSTDILVIRPKKKEWFSFCLLWFFNEKVIEHSDLGSGGTRMPRTNWAIIGGYLIPKPDNNRIVEFDKSVRPAIEKMKKNIRQIRTLEKLRDTLLPNLMSGEVRVKI